MRVLVTGATGFAGQWLIRELAAAGHDAIGTPRSTDLDIMDEAAVAAFVGAARPDAVAHLAGVSYGPDARRDPDLALAINEGGTHSVMAAVAGLATARSASVPVLLVSSSEVYGRPALADLPLGESAPLSTDQPYGLSKLAQERVAFEFERSRHVPVVVARAFNHAGPGQRPEFVVPALAARIVEAATSGGRTVHAGNVDVQRDFSDVRDVVRAYRLLLECLVAARLPPAPRVYNVASGRAVSIRGIIDRFAALAGIDVTITIDPALVRAEDPPEIRGDPTRITADVGWRPTIPLEATLADVLAEARSAGG